MNRLLYLFILIFISPHLSNATDLQSAVIQGHINAKFFSTGKHRNNCIKLHLENKSNTVSKINIKAGTYLANEDTNRQDIILVEEIFFILKPKEKRDFVLKGLCCKQKRSCPKEDDSFIVRLKIDPQTAALCNLLADLKEFEYAGQQALWSLVGNSDPNYIVGSDSTSTMKLRAFVGSALNKPVRPFIWTSYNRPAIITAQSLTIKSKGNHYMRQVQENDLIEFAIYNEADSAVSEVRKERVIANRWNKHNCVWRFELNNLNPSEKYYMRIKVNGTIQKEWMYYFWT